MNLENDIFKRCFVDYRKLKKYGFRKIKKEILKETDTDYKSLSEIPVSFVLNIFSGQSPRY